MKKDFMDYPIIDVDGIKYIEVDNFKDAMILKDLWNTDKNYLRTHFAQSPEKKMDYEFNIPFPGFKVNFWYIHLSPRFYNTSNS